MNLLKRIRDKHLKKFQHFWEENPSHWIAMSVNNSQYRQAMTNIQIEALSHNAQSMLQWGTQQNGTNQITLINNQKVIKDTTVSSEDNQIFQERVASLIHLQMIRSREHLINWSKSLEAISGQEMIQGEDKALEWIKVSLIVLKKALEDSLSDKQSTIQAMLFSGERPGENHLFYFKLRIYNLDIEIQEASQGAIITVYDKKSAEDFLAEHQVLKSPIRALINPIIDEIIKVLPLIEIKIKLSAI